MFIFGLVGGEDNDAYAETEFGGITDDNVLTATEQFDNALEDCGEEG